VTGGFNHTLEVREIVGIACASGLPSDRFIGHRWGGSCEAAAYGADLMFSSRRPSRNKASLSSAWAAGAASARTAAAIGRANRISGAGERTDCRRLPRATAERLEQ
jgi:hypothetical protein